MKKFDTLTAVAAPLPLINVDTDMTGPRVFKTIKRTGLGKSLFYTLRYDEDGREREGFVLNKPAYKDAEILVTGSNLAVVHPGSMRLGPWMISASVVLLPRLRRHFL